MIFISYTHPNCRGVANHGRVAEGTRPSPEAVATRAPAGLSSHCSANANLWLTTAVLVYDIAVEAYCPWRVRRQFGQRQEIPVPTALELVSRQDHR